jgi:SAM-dependent methyltransferase
VRRVLDDVLYKYPAGVKTHLDLACGTGYAIEYFEKRGFRSTGVDASLPMLAVGRKRASRLIAADIRALPLRRTFARITCLYDSLNHMQAREDLVAAFVNVRKAMNAESLFFFDMNHPDIYPAVWGMREPFISDGPEHHLEIATKYERRAKRAIGVVSGWAALANGERVAILETHEQHAWSERQIRACLSDAKIEVVELIDFDPFQEIESVDAAGVKLFFVCRRR